MCTAVSFGANVLHGNCYGSNTFLLGFPLWCPPLDPLRKRWGPFLAAQNVAHQAFWSCQNSHAENTKKCWAWKEGTSVSWKDDLVKQGAKAQINRKLGGRNTYWGRSLNKEACGCGAARVSPVLLGVEATHHLWVCLWLGWFTCEVRGAIKGQADAAHLATWLPCKTSLGKV